MPINQIHYVKIFHLVCLKFLTSLFRFFFFLGFLGIVLSFPDTLSVPSPIRRATSSFAKDTARSYACTKAVSSQMSSSAVAEPPSSSAVPSSH